MIISNPFREFSRLTTHAIAPIEKGASRSERQEENVSYIYRLIVISCLSFAFLFTSACSKSSEDLSGSALNDAQNETTQTDSDASGDPIDGSAIDESGEEVVLDNLEPDEADGEFETIPDIDDEALSAFDEFESTDSINELSAEGGQLLFLPILFKHAFTDGTDDGTLPPYPGPSEPTEPTEEPAPEPTGDCDLAARISEPSAGEQPGGEALFWSVDFTNLGDGVCFDNGVELLRFRGSTGAGQGELIGNFETLPELEPGDQVTLNYDDSETPRTGTFRYRIRYAIPHEDINNDNHNPEKTIRFVYEGGSGSFPPPAPRDPGGPDKCDLSAEFSAPQGSTLPGGQRTTFSVDFENLGQQSCQENTIQLFRYSGPTATGNGTRIGGTSNLSSLNGGQRTRLSWRENLSPATGKFTYKIKYGSPHNDANNNNHYPEKTVDYERNGGGGDFKGCDLYARFTEQTARSLPGGRRYEWTVEFGNRGDQDCKSNRISLHRYSGGNAGGNGVQIGGSGNFENLPDLRPNQTRKLEWVENQAPNIGQYTYAIKYASAHNDLDNNNHRPQHTIIYENAGGGGGDFKGCDLYANITEQTARSLPGGRRYEWTIEFGNRGDQDCKSNRISLHRYNGGNASGNGVQIGGSGNFENLRALSPNQTTKLEWVENQAPNIGQYTYAIKYASAHNDLNNNNHRPQHTIIYENSGSGGGNADDCDLYARFTQPLNNSLPGDADITFGVRFENRGKKVCKSNRISLHRYSGSNASGNGVQIGGSGRFENLDDLGPGDEQQLTWRENGTPNSGQYTYAIKFRSTHNDSNNNNHRPTKTVTYNGGGGGGNGDSCDLYARFTQPSGNNLEGGKRYNWRVYFENRGDERCDGNSISLYRYSGSRASGDGVRIGGSGGSESLRDLNPGQGTNLEWTENQSPNSGQYTYAIRYSSAHNDENNNNHRPTKTVTYSGNGGGGGGGGQCDLEATFQGPSGSVVQGGDRVEWRVQLRNRGNGRCDGGRMKLKYYEGQSARGRSSDAGSVNYDNLNPNQSRTYNYQVTGPSKGGYQTFTLDLGSHSDSNSNNHKPRKTVRWRAKGCDLGVEITSPSSSKLDEDRDATWKVKVTNWGNQQCRETGIKLRYYRGNRASGSSTLIGQSETPRMNQDQSRSFSWTRPAPGSGEYTYRIELSSGDANRDNNDHTRTVEYR